MNLNQTIEKAVSVSTPVADAVFASLSWSGASRVVNGIIYGEDIALAENMAKLACKVSSERIRPTTDDVLTLLKTAPEAPTLTEAQKEALLEAGESEEMVQATLQADYQSALDRHAKQVALIEQREEDIRVALDKLFSAKTAELPTFPEDMAELKQRVISKVANRKPRIVSDLSYGRMNAEDVKKELGAINEFLAQAA